MESARITPEPDGCGQKSGQLNEPVSSGRRSLGGIGEAPGLPALTMPTRVAVFGRDDVPGFDRIPHFASARRRLPPDEAIAVMPFPSPLRPGALIYCGPAPLPRRWPELALAFVAGVCAGALFVLILTWRGVQ